MGDHEARRRWKDSDGNWHSEVEVYDDEYGTFLEKVYRDGELVEEHKSPHDSHDKIVYFKDEDGWHTKREIYDEEYGTTLKAVTIDGKLVEEYD